MRLDNGTLCRYRLERAKIDGAYRIREKSDYSDFFVASREDAAVQLEHAETFVKAVEEYIRKNETIE